MSDVLKEICARRYEDVIQKRKEHPISSLIADLKTHGPARPFADKLSEKKDNHKIGLIAEVKKASPSQGIIRPDLEPVEIAKSYESAGATCLSVLTEPHWFKGNDNYIAQIKNNVELPVLRKDFMLDPYQIIESRHIGADCILIIMAALSDAQALELSQAAREYGLDILVEVHNYAERDRVFNTGLPFDLFGINNRNLKTMDIDLETSINLSQDLPKDTLVVSESGLNTHDDLRMMIENDIYCFLIGTSLMRQDNIGCATRKILGA